MSGGGVARAMRIYLSAIFLVLSWLALPIAVPSEERARASSIGVRVPVLAYHNIDYSGSAFSTTPEMLDAQVRWLIDNGYTAITVWQLWDAMVNGGTLPTNPIVLTNDDGWPSAVTFAGILAAYGMPGNYFITNYSDLTADQIHYLMQNGPVQAHTAYHQYLSTLDYAAQFTEIADNKAYIESITGTPVLFVAWPFGDWNQSAVDAAAAAGIIGGFGLGGTGCVVGGADLYNIPRIMMESGDTLETFASKVSAW